MAKQLGEGGHFGCAVLKALVSVLALGKQGTLASCS